VALAPINPAALATSKRFPLGNCSFWMSDTVSGEQKMIPIAVAVLKVICLCVISRIPDEFNVYLVESSKVILFGSDNWKYNLTKGAEVILAWCRFPFKSIILPELNNVCGA
jgi:hypothetical protein